MTGEGALEPDGAAFGESGYEAYKLDAAHRVAEYLRRADRLGPAIEAADLDDVAEVLGYRPASWREADQELEELVLESASDLDAELIDYFHRRLLRQESMIDPVMRELKGAVIQTIE